MRTNATVPPLEPPVAPLPPPLSKLLTATCSAGDDRSPPGNARTFCWAMATRDVLATAHDALLAPPFDPGDFRDALDGLAMAIETLDAVIIPTEEVLSDFFIEDWTFAVVDGECRAGVSTPAKDLYADYVSYCNRSGEEPLKQRTFATRLTERGCGEKRTGSARFRTGIRIIDAETPSQAAFDE